MLKKRGPNLNQQGFASLVIALILIIVMGLLTVAFAQLARREQQTALNKQLSNQAYYAAESGINDIAQKVKAAADAGQITVSGSSVAVNGVTVDKTKCLSALNGNNLLPSPSPSSTTINQQTNTSYTCALVDLSPPKLVYSDLSPGDQRSTIFTPSPAPTSPTFSFNVEWSSADTTTKHNQFPPSIFGTRLGQSGPWNGALYPAVLQFSITPLNNGSSLDRNSLIANTYTAYLRPAQASSGPATYSTGSINQGQIYNASCSGAGTASPSCSVTINNVPYTVPGEDYLIRFLDFYDSSNINVNTTSLGTQFNFSNGQYVIDVTGKAQNVLKRVQVVLSQQPTNGLGTQAIEAKDICKRQQTTPTNTDFINPGGTATVDPPDADACDLSLP